MNTTLVTVEEYLSTVYEPECDYVDGELEDRNVGEKDHSKIQRKLVRLLPDSVAVFPEIRIRVSETRFRVPDVAVYLAEPDEQVFTTPPYLVIEILSPEDRWSRMIRKLDDYAHMGCVNIWIFDPSQFKAYRYESALMAEVQEPAITTFDRRITITLADVWNELQ
jgi:Uma2 family endonuclease